MLLLISFIHPLLNFVLIQKDGFVEFRFELGNGRVILKSQEPLVLNEFHSVRVTRYEQSGTLKVDDQNVIASTAPGNYRGLDLDLPLFIANVPSFDENIMNQTGLSNGFVGCISLLKVWLFFF